MRRLNINVVDDDASVRKALERLIRSAGMEVQTFSSADEYLNAKPPPPDCLVLDVRMAGMSGLELRQRLAETGVHVAIVFISAHEDEQVRQAAMQGDAACFVLKPFEDQLLIDAILAAAAPREP